jgi:hypothetical protein
MRGMRSCLPTTRNQARSKNRLREDRHVPALHSSSPASIGRVSHRADRPASPSLPVQLLAVSVSHSCLTGGRRGARQLRKVLNQKTLSVANRAQGTWGTDRFLWIGLSDGKLLMCQDLMWLGGRDSNPDNVVQRGRKRRR